jgi:hypothetical protein
LQPEIEVVDRAVMQPGPFMVHSRQRQREVPLRDGIVHRADGSPVALSLSNWHTSVQDTLTLPDFPADGVAEPLDGTHLFGGLMKFNFGILLVRCLPRLWALARPEARDVDGSVLFFWHDTARWLKGSYAPDRVFPGWARDLLELCGVRNARLVVAPVRVERLVVPSQIGPVGHPRQRWHPELAAYLKTVRDKIPFVPGYEKVYLSRRLITQKSRSSGGILLEEVLEENLAANGYRIVYPETLPMREQLAVYRSARDLVFADGSPMHLHALVGEPTQRVAIVYRRKPWPIFRGQYEDFGLPVTHIHRLGEVLQVPVNDGKRTHSIEFALLDFDGVRDELAALGMIDPKRWRAPSEGEVAAARSQAIQDVEAEAASGKAPDDADAEED